MGFELHRVKEREYELLKYALYNGIENEPNDRWRKVVNFILDDTDYQKEAIKIVENIMGITTLNGVVTPSILLSNAECVEEKILEELLENILFSYVDKEKKQHIMYIKDFTDVSYLNLILIHPEIKLKERFQKKITNEVVIQYEKEFDYYTITYFLMNDSIDLKYKKKLIDKMSDADIRELQIRWESDIVEHFYNAMKDIDISDFHYECPETDSTSNFEEVLNLLGEKIGEIMD